MSDRSKSSGKRVRRYVVALIIEDPLGYYFHVVDRPDSNTPYYIDKRVAVMRRDLLNLEAEDSIYGVFDIIEGD